MSKLFKIWNKQTCFEIYFRPLTETKVEVTTYLNGAPFCNPRWQTKNNGDNQEVWDVDDARECWYNWVNYGGYEISEVEDYLKGGRSSWDGESMNYRKSKKKKMTGKYMMDLHKKPERTRRRKQRVKSAMTGHDKLKRMNKE